MSEAAQGKAIDCDVHPAVPGMQALLPYLDDHWRTSVQERGIDSLDSISYPPNAPLSARPDLRDANGRAGTNVAVLGRQVRLKYLPRLSFAEDPGVVQGRRVEELLRDLQRHDRPDHGGN